MRKTSWMKYLIILSVFISTSFCYANFEGSRFDRFIEPQLMNAQITFTASRVEKNTPEELALDPSLFVLLPKDYALHILTCKDASVPDEKCLSLARINSKKISQNKTVSLAVQTLVHPPIFVPEQSSAPVSTPFTYETYSQLRIILSKGDSKETARYESDILDFSKQVFLDPHRATLFLSLLDETIVIHLDTKTTKTIKPKKLHQILSFTNPEDAVIEATKTLSLDPNIKALFLKDAGVSEGYSIKEHVIRIARHYQEQKNCWISNTLKEKLLKQNINIDALFPVLLALHDIGKPLAVEQNCKANQHDFTVPIQTQQLEKLKFSKAEVDLAAALVDHDYIGEYLQNLNPLENTLVGFKIQAQKTILSHEDFYKLQLLFYTLDASAYPSLEVQLFTRDEMGCLNLDPTQINALESSFFAF